MKDLFIQNHLPLPYASFNQFRFKGFKTSLFNLSHDGTPSANMQFTDKNTITKDNCKMNLKIHAIQQPKTAGSIENLSICSILAG